jgi:hypothetical protein
MIHRLYIILVLSVLISFAGNSQTISQEPSLDKIQDATSDVKKYDLINYQIIADQKYFKNNPNELTKQRTMSLEEQVSLKSADNKVINVNQTHLDESARRSSSSEVALDNNLSESAEDKFDQKAGIKQLEKKNTSNNQNIKTPNSSNSNPQAKNNVANNGVTYEAKKSLEPRVVVPAKKEKLIVKNVVDSEKLKAVKALVDAPFIQLNDNHKINTKHKSSQLPEVVAPIPVEVKNSYTESTREEKVIDELINSGNYDVYDDGKYIKFSKKRNK